MIIFSDFTPDKNVKANFGWNGTLIFFSTLW